MYRFEKFNYEFNYRTCSLGKIQYPDRIYVYSTNYLAFQGHRGYRRECSGKEEPIGIGSEYSQELLKGVDVLAACKHYRLLNTAKQGYSSKKAGAQSLRDRLQ